MGKDILGVTDMSRGKPPVETAPQGTEQQVSRTRHIAQQGFSFLPSTGKEKSGEFRELVEEPDRGLQCCCSDAGGEEMSVTKHHQMVGAVTLGSGCEAAP